MPFRTFLRPVDKSFSPGNKAEQTNTYTKENFSHSAILTQTVIDSDGFVSIIIQHSDEFIVGR